MATRRARRRVSKNSDPKRAGQKPWTVMLYMAASKDEQTEAAAIRDLEELEKIGTTKEVNVLVQIDRKWPGYSERYVVRKGGSELRGSFPDAAALKRFFDTDAPEQLGEFYTANTEVLRKLLGVKDAGELRKCFCDKNPDVLHEAFSTGNPIVLQEFVRWARAEFPADHYLLVMWGHAFGLGFGRDHGDPLAMPELATALDTSALHVPNGRKAVDIIGANACAMSYAEAAYQLKDAADFVVAPEIAMPFAGWPYEAILSEIVGKPRISAEELGKKIIELFMASFKNAFEPRSVALTLLNLKKAGDLAPHLKAVTDALRPVIKRNRVRDQIANAFLDTAHGEVRPLIDLFDLCERLMEIDGTDAPGVATAARELRTFLNRKNGLIVEPKPELAAELEGLRGLGIFAPSVTGAVDLTRLELSKESYQELSLVKKTGWGDVVYEGLKDALEPVNKAVADFVSATGAVTREDRMGVAQLLLSIHRSFARLESTVTDSQHTVLGLLNGNGGIKPLGAKGEKATRQSQTESGRVYGPPYLRLANGSAQQTYSRVAATSDAPANDRLLKAVMPLANIEDALARVEKTTKRVLTDSRLGLGATPPKPDLGATPPKPDLGATPPKPDLGATPPKPDLGATPPKPDLGLLSVSMLTGFDNGASTLVTGLFGQVVWSLQLLEQAVGKLEGVVQLVLTSPTNGMNGSMPDDYQRRLEEQLKGSFREVTDVAINAKLTLGAVLRHPSQGIGPTSQSGLGAERQQLAMLGGLSSRNLSLL
jgi:hypothetical protein